MALMYLGISNSSFDMLFSIYALATLVPTIAVACRRMHDVNKSGWFMLIPIYSLVLACTNGDTGSNQYGSDPKGGDEISDIGKPQD